MTTVRGKPGVNCRRCLEIVEGLQNPIGTPRRKFTSAIPGGGNLAWKAGQSFPIAAERIRRTDGHHLCLVQDYKGTAMLCLVVDSYGVEVSERGER